MNNHFAHYSLPMVISQCLRLSGQRISYPLIKAFVFSTRGNNRLFVDRRRHSHVKPPRVGFFWGNAFFCTHIQKDPKGYFPLFFQIGNVIGIKISTTIKPDKLTTKHINIRVVGDKGFIVAKCHQVIHGFMVLKNSIIRKPHKDQHSPIINKKHLTRECFIGSIESLTKTISGHRTRQTSGFFMPIVWAYSRLYDGLRRPNIIPLGNKSRRLIAVSETRRLIMVALSKLKLSGEHYYA